MNFPLQFYKYNFDWQIRDSKLFPILKIDVNGLDYQGMAKVEEFCKKTIEFWNAPQRTVADDILDSVKANGNDPILNEAPKRRGRPPRSNGH